MDVQAWQKGKGSKNRRLRAKKGEEILVSHLSAIGDTISCDRPLERDNLQKQAFSAIPPLLGLSLVCDRPFLQKEGGGGSSDSLRYHRKHSATGVVPHVSRDGGGHFGRVTKEEIPKAIEVRKSKAISGHSIPGFGAEEKP